MGWQVVFANGQRRLVVVFANGLRRPLSPFTSLEGSALVCVYPLSFHLLSLSAVRQAAKDVIICQRAALSRRRLYQRAASSVFADGQRRLSFHSLNVVR